MTHNFTVSPDFNPGHISGWYIFNTWLQRAINEEIHLELYNSAKEQRKAIADDQVELIYANPYDATALVRDKGFIPVARADNKADEAIIAVNHESPILNVEQLTDGTRISSTDDPDVRMMCMIMLEPAGLNKSNTITIQRDAYILIAKDLLKNDADIGFFLEETYNELSDITKKQLRPIVHSQIHVIHHLLLVGPKLAHKKNDMQSSLLSMADDSKGAGVLKSLNFERWVAVEQEEAEFMIDLMDTLAE
ncbi:MAG: phosphate/phosphite/phosphonate ABC transporter substrate-binding protein [Gammaproteobacteria bacterium]|nr:phosphate/phosphite/phosphonate ABC transporter substrate-binding protein [Gammaproteobacteria bacterium]